MSAPTHEDLGISRWIRIRAEQQGNVVALIAEGESEPTANTVTFRKLEEAVEQTAAGLRACGVQPGDRVIVMVEPGLAFFAAAFGIFRIGAVMIGVDPGMGIRRVRTALNQVEPVGFIGNWKAQLARVLFRWGEHSVRFSVTAGHPAVHKLIHLLSMFRGMKATALTFSQLQSAATRIARSQTPALQEPSRARQHEPAAILFTSGSTGPPKGVLYTHGLFEAQLDALRNIYSIRPGERELATFPLFALFAPALGMSAVIPIMDFTRPGAVDPEHLLSLIERHSVTSMFGSPALLRRLSTVVIERDTRLSSLRRVVSAGAPVPADLLARLSSALAEDASIHTPYGATEALPVTSIDAAEVLAETAGDTVVGRGVCVGLPCQGMDVRIIPIEDGELEASVLDCATPPGAIGEIAVRGPVVTAQYVNDTQATQTAKLFHPNGLYHRMGDVGYLDEGGRLWFCGRKSERVRLVGKELYTVPVEAIFNRHPAVARSALVGVPHAGTLQPVIIIELHPRPAWETPLERTVLTAELLNLARGDADAAAIHRVLFHPRFPVDPRHNAKIGRPELARWARAKLA